MDIPTKAEVLRLLKLIKPNLGSARRLNRKPELKFIEAFKKYVNSKKFLGNASVAIESLGLNRNYVRGIIQRTLGNENRNTGKIFQGTTMQTTVPVPKNAIPFKEATTKVKYDKNFLKTKIKKFNKNKFYTPKDIGNILKIDTSSKRDVDDLTDSFKRFNVLTKKKSERQKLYKLGDVVNKLTTGFKNKLVKGDRKSQSNRTGIVSRTDKPLNSFIAATNDSIRKLSKDFDIFQPNAVEDVGHPMSVKITDKFPKLFKNSNINKISTLVFQDPEINRKLLEATGYESKHEKLFKRLNSLLGKRVTPVIQKEIIDIKKEMNALYEKVMFDINKASRSGTTLYNNKTKKYTTIQGSYFKGQENRIPKIDLEIPRIGNIFKSENLFADMSVVDDSYRVGQVHKINPKAKILNDLTAVEKELFKETFINQSRNNIQKFYTKAGYPTNEISELNEAFDVGTFGRKSLTNPNLISRLAKAGKVGLLSALGLTTLAVAGNTSETTQPQVTQPQVIEKPETVQYNRDTGSFINPITQDKTDQNQLLQWGQENPLTAVAGTSVALSAQEIPRNYKMRRGVGDTGPLPGGKGRIRSSIGIGGALKPVLTTLGTPLIGLGFEGLMAKERLENDETMSDILMDPLGPSASLAFMEPLSRSSGVVRGAPTGIANYFKNYGDLSNVGQARPGLTSKALRLGLSPRMIAGASRFLGLPGLALTTGLAGYNAYKNYQNEEGMIYDFFNKDE